MGGDVVALGSKTNTLPFGRRLAVSVANFDWWLLFAAVVLMFVGMMSLYSIDHDWKSNFFRKHLLRIAIGVGPFLLFFLVKPRKWIPFVPILYFINLGLLLMVILMGRSGGGATRWIDIGPIEFQPSEVAKMLLILTVSAFYASRAKETHKLSTFLTGFALMIPPMALIYKQPHLGATLVVFVMFLGVSLAARVPPLYVIGALVACIGALVAAFFIPGAMDEYQKARIIGLLHPDKDKSAFQVNRSLMAFGAGGVSGTGFLKGEQKAGHFIPEQETDFIFSVVGEEGGLIGATLVLVTFGLLFYRLWWGSFMSRDPFHAMLLSGILCVLGFHFFANTGMVLGILPVVGLWLPFMSYGGTALWLCMACVGLALNIRQQDNEVDLFE